MVVHSAGHQWGAAFPAHDDDVPGSAVPRQMDCHLDAKRRVVVCGDYFGAHRGTAEGAYERQGRRRTVDETGEFLRHIWVADVELYYKYIIIDKYAQQTSFFSCHAHQQ